MLEPCFSTDLQRIADLRIMYPTRVFVCWPTPPPNIRSLTKAVQERAPLHSGEGKGLKEAAARSLTPLLPSFVFTRVRHPRRRE